MKDSANGDTVPSPNSILCVRHDKRQLWCHDFVIFPLVGWIGKCTLIDHDDDNACFPMPIRRVFFVNFSLGSLGLPGRLEGKHACCRVLLHAN